jgi:hypothetical protein
VHEVWAEIVAGAALMLLGGIVAFVRVSAKRTKATVRMTGQMLEDWRGVEPRPGVPGRPGVMERLQTGDEHFQQIDGQLAEVTGRLDSIEEKVDHLASEIPANGMKLADKIDALYRHFIDPSYPERSHQ